MPFVAKEEVQELHTLRSENERMAAQLSEFQEMRPHLALAEEIRNEIVAALENNDQGLDARTIAEQAYSNVLKRKVDEARDEVAAKYEQEHRRNLYERLLGEVATSEGDDISKKVRDKVETDPEMATQLRDSARKELAARATDVVRKEITEEQQAVINEEADRQIGLDRLDVKLALDGELDLSSDDVIQKIKPGDKVLLFYTKKNEGKRRQYVELVWAKDAKGKEGWVFRTASDTLSDKAGDTQAIDENRFVTVGVLNKDFDSGEDVVQPNKLVVGKQLVLSQKNARGTMQHIRLFYQKEDRYNSYYGRYDHEGVAIELAGTDFQTKDIQFFSASAA